MKKLIFSLVFLFICFISFCPSEVEALTVSEISGLNYCGNNTYTYGEAMTDGSFRFISCHGNYNDALNVMNSTPLDNGIILIRQNDVTSIYDAKYALLDLTGNGTKTGSNITHYFADNTTTMDQYDVPVVNYMNHAPAYGSTDGAYLGLFERHRSARVMVNNFKGYVIFSGYYSGVWENDYRIVPLAWVKSSSYYHVDNDNIWHCSVNNIRVDNGASSCRSIGPKPSMLNNGTYYSYDGKYFYTDLKTMLSDYKVNQYSNAVNAGNVYYNYYMYLPHRSKSTYSSADINKYFRDLGYWGTVPGANSNYKAANTSQLYGSGNYFYSSQEIYGTNAMLMLAVSRNETGHGRSSLAVTKNNGFGHNAVDSDPSVSANKYANFASSIYAHAYSWISGYANPSDWRSYGSIVGNKGVGMNIKYASDPYWGEKAAMFYKQIDAHYGYQDYDYYQLAVSNHWMEAKAEPSGSSKTVYNYKQHDMGMILVDDVINEGILWYKVVSEVSLDANKNQMANSSEFNWDDSYVYVRASDVTLANVGKNGFISPTDVYEYVDSEYRYYFYTENAKEMPKTAVTTVTSNYYYDAGMMEASSSVVLKDKYVMVYAEARDSSNNVVAYLVTSDYYYDQQLWVPASSIAFVTLNYGYRWIDQAYLYESIFVTTSSTSTVIGRTYNDAFLPIVDTKYIDGTTWYQVPVSLNSNTNSYGWVRSANGSISRMDFIEGKGANNVPVLSVGDVTLVEGSTFDKMSGVSASDLENGDLTSLITIESDNLDLNTPGTYQITYSVKDYDNNVVTKVRTITVIEDQVPVINASNFKILINSTFDPLSGVSASDKEDGTISVSVTTNTVDTTAIGTYKVVYTTTDSFGHVVTKEVEVVVGDKEIRDSVFYLDYMKDVNGKLQIKGYSTISGINNTLNTDITYTIVYEDINDASLTYEQVISRITDTNDMSRPIFSNDGFDYTYSWFTGNIDLTLLPEGNYRMYVVSEAPSYYSKTLVTNKLYKEQSTGFSGEKEVFTQINFSSRTGEIILYVRDEVLANKTANYDYNQYDTYRIWEFENDLLNIMGHTASYGMDLSNPDNITRSIVFENKNTYDTYSYDIGSTNSGLYDVFLPVDDGLSKSYAWYNTSIDLSTIPIGEYVIYITTSSNITDIAELSEKLSRNLDDVILDINNKTYSFNINMDKGNRIELIVEG